MHRSEEKFIAYVLQRGREIVEADVKSGDIAIYKIGRCYAHGAIVVAWPEEIVHAYKPSGCVLRSGGREAELKDVPVRFFTVF